MTAANILLSFVTGLCVAGGIVWFTPVVEETKVGVKIDEKEKAALQKSPHLKKFFGVSEAEMDAKPKQDLDISSESHGEQNMEDTSVDDPIFKVRFALSVIVGISGIYAANVVSKGDFGRFIAGMFPVETEALKIKAWLERWQ